MVMKKSTFIKWIYDRLVNVHGENPQVDYLIRLSEIIQWLEDKGE
jgi:hypothetical protein